MLAVDDAANFIGPDVTRVGDLLWIVDSIVSRVLAVRYVPPYSIKMRAKGFEKRRF
jgi:hypothetical protein